MVGVVADEEVVAINGAIVGGVAVAVDVALGAGVWGCADVT